MLRRLWQRWKIVAHKIGTFQSRVLLTVFYCLILAPFGIGVKLLSDPLRLKGQSGSNWLEQGKKTAARLEAARRQF